MFGNTISKIYDQPRDNHQLSKERLFEREVSLKSGGSSKTGLKEPSPFLSTFQNFWQFCITNSESITTILYKTVGTFCNKTSVPRSPK